MKKLSFVPIEIILVGMLLALLLSGCINIKGTRNPQGQLTLQAKALFVSVEGATFTATDQNGFTTTLSVNKVMGDEKALATLSEGMIGIASLVLRSPTNTPPK